jgi:hypothetical protein
MVWSTTEINDESHNQKANDCDNLHTGEDKFGFTVNLDGEDIQADDDSDDEGDPGGNSNVLGPRPVLNYDGGSRYFGTESDCAGIPVLLEQSNLKLA